MPSTILKTDKVLDRLTKRLDNLIRGGGSSPSTSGRWDLTGKTIISQQELDDIETERYGEPHRFSDYRLARAKKTAPAIGLTYEDVYDTITQEELDWELRQQLKVSPEQRYQHGKYHWYSHPSSWYKSPS
jgi:hypothetical protein